MNKETIVPEYLDFTLYEENGNPYDGDRLVTMPETDKSLTICCILRFSEGKLDGKYAVEMNTGYMEEWQNGKYIASRSLCCQRKQKKLTQKEKEDIKIAKIQNDFKNRNFTYKGNRAGEISGFILK